MGRDNKQGTSNNKRALPQTPKKEKIPPEIAQEEFSKELAELEQLVNERKRKNGEEC